MAETDIFGAGDIEVTDVKSVIDKDGQEVGRIVETLDGSAVVSLHIENKDDAHQMVQNAGYNTEKVYDWTKECDVENHRPCELATAVGFARDISDQEGVAVTPKLQQIVDSGKLTESGVKDALAEWKQSMPESREREADDLIDITFNEKNA